MRAVTVLSALLMLATAVPTPAVAEDESLQHDVWIDRLSLYPGNATIYWETHLRVAVTVYNADMPDDGFTLDVTVCPADDRIHLPETMFTACHTVASTYTDGMPANGALIESFEWATYGYLGDWDLCASIDNEDDHPENNVRCERVYVGYPPLWFLGLEPGVGIRLL